MRPPIDPAFYDDTQLDDDEIRDRDIVRQALAAGDLAMERERQRKMRNFAFKGGML